MRANGSAGYRTSPTKSLDHPISTKENAAARGGQVKKGGGNGRKQSEGKNGRVYAVYLCRVL